MSETEKSITQKSLPRFKLKTKKVSRSIDKTRKGEDDIN